MTRNKDCTRYYSSSQEEKVAKELGGNTTPNSGATTFKKFDVIVPGIVGVECKTSKTIKESFSIKKDWIEKNQQEAFSMRLPESVICFDFGPQSKRYYVLDENQMKYLVEKWKEDYE